MWNVGNNGYGWSRTAKSSTTAYFLNMNPTDVNPSNNNHRWVSLPLRWVARAVPIFGSLKYPAWDGVFLGLRVNWAFAERDVNTALFAVADDSELDGIAGRIFAD